MPQGYICSTIKVNVFNFVLIVKLVYVQMEFVVVFNKLKREFIFINLYKNKTLAGLEPATP